MKHRTGAGRQFSSRHAASSPARPADRRPPRRRGRLALTSLVVGLLAIGLLAVPPAPGAKDSRAPELDLASSSRSWDAWTAWKAWTAWFAWYGWAAPLASEIRKPAVVNDRRAAERREDNRRQKASRGSARTGTATPPAAGADAATSVPGAEAAGAELPGTEIPGSEVSGTELPGTDGASTKSSGGTGTASRQAPAPTAPTAPKAPAPGAPSTGGPFVAYTADSFFRAPLPANTPVSSTSAQAVAFAKAHDPSPYLKVRGAHGVGWGIAYGLADCSDPVYRIGSSGNLPASQQHLRDVGFRAPASMWKNIPPNSDAPFLVIDTCGTSARPGGLSVWGAGASASGSTITVSAAGSFSHDSNGLDRRNPAADSKLNERSRGVIPDSMVVRLDLLEHAIRTNNGLGHVLEVFWVETDTAAGHVHPMVGAESGKAGYGAEGERFRIKAGIDLAARPGCNPATNPVGLAIARTLQQHGAYIGDNSGSGSGIKTEQNAKFPGLTADSLRGCMTWDDIEFLPRGWDPTTGR